ncbi:MAG: hypothetical protein Q7R72_02130 [bacterium]|nr:hypothetical protein [bacterium]
MVAAESSEKISKEIINKVSKLATREDIKSEIKSDGDNTRKDINSATAALVDKATLSVGEINKHSSGLAKSIQEKVDATGSSLEQIKKTLDEQKPAPTTDEMRRTVGETLLAFKRLEQPATVPSNVPAANATENETSTTSVVSVTPVTVVSQSASVAVVPAMAITQGIVNEKLNREYLSPGTISRRYTAEMIRHGKVKITKRYGIVTVNNHLPGTWHRAEQISQIKILPTNGITTYSDADWVTFTSASPMEIELRR